MIMVGGLRVFTGPILGAALITQLSAYVSKYTGAWGLIFGGFLILYLMISREGILDVLALKWSGFKKLREEK
jgi:branched-chain amino acid transport system permease protein